MTRYLFFLIILFALSACKPQIKDFDNTAYDLYQESQFANGFALIKDQYGKRLDPNHDEHNYPDGIMNASVMFGEMDLLDIKKQVISRMNIPNIEKDDEGIWRPLYDGVRKSHGHGYKKIEGWVYWLIFNPQVDKAKIGPANEPLIDIAIVTAMSRANVSYWHKKIMDCMKKQIQPEQLEDLHVSWMPATEVCQKEYVDMVSNIAAGIYPKIQELPQYKVK